MFIGVDPGLGGALAVLADDGTLVSVQDTPTITLKVARGTRHEYDCPGMVGLLTPYAGAGLHVVIEAQQSMPGQGVRSTFVTGYGYGAWVGILATLQIPYTPVRSGIWKRSLGLSSDKEASRLRAMQLFPAADLRLRKHHGRAESILLAWYGWQYRRGEPLQMGASA